jgi:dipeptidyl aminopeptidase/acylaminoacyl peptidase
MRNISARDLAGIRDIGRSEPMSFLEESPLGLSPDGQELAFILNRADVSANRYCRALIVLNVHTGTPRVVDTGGDFIALRQDLRGLLGMTGVADATPPRWSPDGQWLAYLRRDRGVTQLWRVSRRSRKAQAVTRSRVDIEAFQWLGEHLLVASRPGLRRAYRLRAEEGLRGFRFDDRFVPMRGMKPGIRGNIPQRVDIVDPATGRQWPADARSAALLIPAASPAGPQEPVLKVNMPGGAAAWLATRSPERYPSVPGLGFTSPDGTQTLCQDSVCTGAITGLWPTPDGRSVWFGVRDRPERGATSFYRWTPRDKRARLLQVTEDVIAGCLRAGPDLLCLHEASLTPRRLIWFDPETNRQKVLFEPNPEFHHFRHASVRRLRWKNSFGFPAFGDLVLPPGYTAGRLPLIVVQYRSRGFLRGGTGDEYPILPLAAKGFAVLSVDKPGFYATNTVPEGFARWQDAERLNVSDWNERKSVASSLLSGIDAVRALGVIDSAKVGITGLSDGSTTAWYLLINSDAFAATAVSTCCADPKTDLLAGGMAWAAEREEMGYPSPIDDRPDFWRPVSPAMNAARIRTPVLLQLADEEAGRALEAFDAFRRARLPTDMYIFPAEHHVKMQPAHRLAIYERVIDWFSFWLQGRIDPDPAKADQYARWQALQTAAKGR